MHSMQGPSSGLCVEWSNSVPYLEVRILTPRPCPQNEESELQREAGRECLSVITQTVHVRRQIQHKPCLPQPRVSPLPPGRPQACKKTMHCGVFQVPPGMAVRLWACLCTGSFNKYFWST